MPDELNVALEILANLLYLAQIEADQPAKVREYMMMAEVRLDEVVTQVRGARGLRSEPVRLH